MNIILQWDPSVSTLPQSTEALFKAAITYVADYYDRVLTSPYTVTINVGWGEITQDGTTTKVTGGSSEGGPDDVYTYSYAQVRAALQSHIDSPATAAAFADLPTTDPTNGQGVAIGGLQAEAIGLPTQGGAFLTQGSVGFGPPQQGDTYNFSTTDRAIANESDFVGIALHEISHALGRFSDIGDSGPWQPAELDLFRFASPGVLTSGTYATAYFSINGGTTALKYWDSTNSDPSDWMSSGANASSGDSYDAYYEDGVENFVTSADLDVMNLAGFPITPNVPGDDFNGNEVSDLLLENTSGAVVVGELATGTAQYGYATTLASGWTFEGSGDFLGDGQTDFLLENAAGAVVAGEVVNGAAQFSYVTGLGPEWTFKESGDFLGDGKADFLLEDTAGAVVVGELVSGAAQFTYVTGLGPEWSFEGAGDFLGDGKDQFLLENTSGAVEVGEIVNGAAQFTSVATIAASWTFEESGDFLGDGKDQFLLENTAGAVVAGEVVNGAAQFTYVTGLGPEWHFVGAGDYAGTGTDSFAVENTAGAVVTGTVVNGAAQYSYVTTLASQWSFHG